jgi:bisanhydrobacterioruberin hydratase
LPTGKHCKITRVLTQLRRATPRPLILACALALLAALFVVRFPDLPGAGIGSYFSTFLIALPSTVALFRYLGPQRAILSLLALSAFAYAIESLGVATGFPYGRFFYGDALGPTVAGLVPFLLPVSYAPLVVGAVAAAWGGPRLLHVAWSALILVWMDAVLDPGATALGFWVWPEGGAYYGVPPSNFAGWLLSGALAAALLLATGRWAESPRPALLDSAAISTAFWTAVAAFSGIILPALLGTVLFVYLLARRTYLHAVK